MNDTEIPADIRVSEVRPLQFLILLLCQVRHGTLELGNDATRGEIAGSKDT